jgi:O-antigen ligase
LAILLGWLFVVALYQNFSQWNYLPAYNSPNPKRITAIFSYPNALSLLTAPLAGFFAVFWLYQKKQKYNWLYALLALGALVLAFLALSQGALLAIVISLFFYLILAKKVRKWGRPLAVLILFLLLIFGNVSYYLQKIYQEVKNPEINLSASSLEIRSDQWRETALMLQDNFIFGAGLDGYQKILRSYLQTSWLEIYLYPHNIFLNFWTEMGLLGLLVFLALLFYIVFVLSILFKEKNSLAWPLALTWLIWFIHGLVDVPYFKNDLSILFFLLLFLTIWARENKGEADISQI